MKIDFGGLLFLKGVEGCSLTAYRDGKGYSIGYGHHSTYVNEGDEITLKQADEYLLKDVSAAEDVVNKSIFAYITQNQFNALVSLAFNIGSGGFRKSPIISAVNNQTNEQQPITDAFNKHVIDVGTQQTSSALATRRQKEIDLYFTKTDEDTLLEEVTKDTPSNAIYDKKSTSKYIHTDPSITTVDQLLNLKGSPFYQLKEKDFNEIIGEDGFSNKTRLQLHYNSINDEKYPLLKLDSVLYIKESLESLSYLALENPGGEIDIQSFPTFIFDYLKDLYSNPKYVPTAKVNFVKNLSNSIDYINSLVSVWIYCKALKKIINITPFCTDVSTIVNGSEQDNFSINLLPFDIKDSGSFGLNLQEKISYNNDFSLKFFQYVTSNDIVFIKFEELECDKDYKEGLEIDKSVLKDSFFDFLGLVGTCNVDRNLSTDIQTINIVGSSFTKVFQEDEAIFFPQAVIAESTTGNLLIGSQSNDSFIRRTFSDGEYNFIWAKSFRSIGDTLKFYINQLSNISVVNDPDLFRSYKDEVSKKWVIKGGDQSLSLEEQKGIFKIIKLGVDPSLENLCLVDSSISNPNGNILSLFRKAVRFPYAEMVMDTYKNVFGIVVRRPPFDKKSIQEYFKLSSNIYLPQLSSLGSVQERDVFSDNFSWEDNFYTWYKFEVKGKFLGLESAVALSGIPIIYFPELVDMFGSRPMSVEDNYTPPGTNLGSEEHKKQIILNASYVIESNVYLPFTRKGSIILNKGDRRFKKGTWIYYSKTDEIFYIDSVTNNVSITNNSISRGTILQVSRGMVWKHFDKYFEIFDLKEFRNQLEKYLLTSDKSGFSRSILVNKKIFEFFISRQQFD